MTGSRNGHHVGETELKVAFIGLGSMGALQAKLIARGGVELAVYDPHAPALQAFEGMARLAHSVADAACGVEIACVCVRDDQQVRDVVLGPDGLAAHLRAGALILVHSTTSLALIEDARAQLSSRGIALVDAPVSRTRPGDDGRFVFTMLGGEDADVERARPVVETFSTSVQHMGPLGAGMATKIANNLVTWTHIVVGAQATALAAGYGVAYDKLRAVMKANGNLTPTVELMLDAKAKAPSGPSPERDAFQASQAGIGEKDLALAAEVGGALGMDMGMAAEARRAVRRMMTGQPPRS